MPKLILIFLLAFVTDPEKEKTEKDDILRNASIVYSEKAIDFESGQPVFTSDVKATLIRKSNQDGVRVMINDSLDVKLFSEVIDIFDLIDPTEGTYTVVIEVGNKTETFGFTIR